MMPIVCVLPAADPRIHGTVAAIRRDIEKDGFILRYRRLERNASIDGLPAGEGAFLPCSFWLADCLQLTGQHSAARELLDRLLAIRNDLGLLAEEYDPRLHRQLGNFPQAFSHVGLINTARNLTDHTGPAAHRCQHSPG